MTAEERESLIRDTWREAVSVENKGCAELARKDAEYYAGLYKITKQKKWGEAADAAEIIAMNIEARPATRGRS